MVFDGKGFAAEVEEGLRVRADGVAKSLGRRPKLVSIYNPLDEPSRVYTTIKSRKAKELGVEFEVYQLDSLPVAQLSELVNKLNSDKGVDGVMIQLPFPKSEDLIPLIDPKKDVDGLREDSRFLPATVRAVLAILGEAKKLSAVSGQLSVVVVGSKGEVGRRLVTQLHSWPAAQLVEMGKEDFDPGKLSDAQVIISATGQAGLITSDMVRDGVIAIDVGYPKGDFDPGVADKAAFFTPVPGGVGPVTVVMLFANLLEASELVLVKS